MRITLSDHRLKTVYAEIADQCARTQGKIGEMISELKGIWKSTVGDIVQDELGALSLDRSRFQSPSAYLACNVDALVEAATFHLASTNVSMVRQSEQWKHEAAEKEFRKWAAGNDPKCFDDDSSFWNELRSEDL